MAIHQTKQTSDIEKRLRLLRQQVYGKSSEDTENLVYPKVRISDSQISDAPIYRHTDSQSHSESFRTDITYLHQDLLKISLLASLALGAQIILFYLSQNNFLRINLL